MTATTVGYGDISPHTILGRITAVILMFNGIGLISALTSAVTMYLASDDPDTGAPQAMSIADEIRQFHDLADDGIITASEFEQQKRRLLALNQADRED
ncbi:ion channel [Schleiferilactobacillus harbinensis]|uniref:ion channel n=1 Tax=Schleiferilactobacillus harbinensis TaxID=304207 RepID=UPI001CC32513|nr:ion channel [Schleiferilactobacillus harbinensis]